MIPGGKHRRPQPRHKAEKVQSTEPAPPEYLREMTAKVPKHMYTTTPDGTVIRSKIIGFHPQLGFPMTSRVWETAPNQPTE